MPALLPLGPDELLSTTRSVRKRLDLTRPVEDHLLRECLELAAQAPTGSNAQGWHFIVVRDADTRAALGALYRRAWSMFYGDVDAAVEALPKGDPDHVAATRRVLDSASHLADHLGEVPVHVIPCIRGRLDEKAPVAQQAAMWGSLLPAAWSFMLAARARGLGTCWTTLHLVFEREAQELLGIPDHVTQGALIPVAHVLGGTDFKPGPRRDLDRIVHVDRW